MNIAKTNTITITIVILRWRTNTKIVVVLALVPEIITNSKPSITTSISLIIKGKNSKKEKISGIGTGKQNKGLLKKIVLLLVHRIAITAIKNKEITHTLSIQTLANNLCKYIYILYFIFILYISKLKDFIQNYICILYIIFINCFKVL